MPDQIGPCMLEVAEITCVATGETRRYVAKIFDTSHIQWQWSEGNYGCDCARATFFARANGEPEPKRPCGDGGYRVRVLVLGDLVYADG